MTDSNRLEQDEHFSWLYPDEAEKAMLEGHISLDEYLAGLFYHPNYNLWLAAEDKYA